MEVTMAEEERTEEEEHTGVEGMVEAAMVEEVEMAAILTMTEVVVVEGMTEGLPGASHHSSQVTGTAKTVGLTTLRGERSVSSAEQAKSKKMVLEGKISFVLV